MLEQQSQDDERVDRVRRRRGAGRRRPQRRHNPNGILKYGYDFSAQFSNIDPGKSQSPCSAIVTAPIFDTLIHLDIHGNLQPGLATSWDTTVNPNTVTLHLRPGVTFSDGEAFDANAVKTGILHNATQPAVQRPAGPDVGRRDRPA